ncbi:gamma-glutamyl-gamma-aminobutyrate hydrolase [Vulcanimicrobium alpinum]|uniref:Gamma-glutamyl-gamma-aminobutyrate hydrolase n=1 Tax=Vulcanimicrobium alpinum TaxID=3016050 RepID=A0AAN1XXZ5_UNVUL|nr:gamma-glutamyl-gamma-aminobutyrate hydrolase [Vulcanimicrobium alpinum]
MVPRIALILSTGSQGAEYQAAVREAGGEPVRVSAADPDAGVHVLDGVEALLLCGGGDVAPERYDAAPSSLTDDVDTARDELEIALIRAARERGIPTLCICRGMQVANVAFGGTLIQDIPEALGPDAPIRHALRDPSGRGERGLIPGHIVRIEPASMLARIVGTHDLPTGARHHQAAERIAADLCAVAHTDDGIVEALEARFPSPFWLAVQWHPESTRTLDGGASLAIFRAFADAAARVPSRAHR